MIAPPDGPPVTRQAIPRRLWRRISLPWRAGLFLALAGCRAGAADSSPAPAGSGARFIDLSGDQARQVVVDRDPGQYLGHPSTVLLEDGRTLLCVYPLGHGQGAIQLKRSPDGGRTWSARLPVPASWASSRETPTLHRVVDRDGKRRLIVWSGLYPARFSLSEDDGLTWSELQPAGNWGGIVVMSSLEPLRDGAGRYLGLFHDDGRFFGPSPRGGQPAVFTLYKTVSGDGGRSWSIPEPLWQGSDIHLCEPGLVRSPDGKELAVLLRENARRKLSHVMFSGDEGRTWSLPQEVSAALTGDRHVGRYVPDGRLVVSFRDTAPGSPTQGDWVAWVGTYADLRGGGAGQYRVRLMDNTHAWDCAYPGVVVLPEGSLVCTTYGHWTRDESPYIVSIRFSVGDLDRLAGAIR